MQPVFLSPLFYQSSWYHYQPVFVYPLCNQSSCHHYATSLRIRSTIIQPCSLQAIILKKLHYLLKWLYLIESILDYLMRKRGSESERNTITVDYLGRDAVQPINQIRKQAALHYMSPRIEIKTSYLIANILYICTTVS